MVFDDSQNGIIHMIIPFSGTETELRLSVVMVGGNASRVSLEMLDRGRDNHELIDFVFSTLDYLLTDREKVELMERENQTNSSFKKQFP